jgi:hypothetical protein
VRGKQWKENCILKKKFKNSYHIGLVNFMSSFVSFLSTSISHRKIPKNTMCVFGVLFMSSWSYLNIILLKRVTLISLT